MKRFLILGFLLISAVTFAQQNREHANWLFRKNVNVQGTLTAEGALVTSSTVALNGPTTFADSVYFADKVKLRVTTVTDSTVSVNVNGYGIVAVNDSQNCAINGFSGGSAGQIIYLVNVGSTNIVLKHNGSGTQKMQIAADVTITSAGGATLYCNGTAWYIVSVML